MAVLLILRYAFHIFMMKLSGLNSVYPSWTYWSQEIEYSIWVIEISWLYKEVLDYISNIYASGLPPFIFIAIFPSFLVLKMH